MTFALNVILISSGAVCLAGLLLVFLVWLFVRRRLRPGFWKRVARAHLILVPLYLLLAPSILLAGFTRYSMGTRGDELEYAGPRVASDGVWSFQSRASLREERDGDVIVDDDVSSRAAAREVRLESAPGVRARGFLVESVEQPPRFQAVLVHGLFRGALELEKPAAWLHEAGGDVLMVEMRNHGASDRGPPGFGAFERLDVLAAARFLRSRPGGDDLPLLVYGISLGSAAVLLAAPEIDGLGAVAVDAAIPELVGVYHNLLRDRIGMHQPWRSLTLTAVELLCGFDAAEVRPVAAADLLDPTLPSLVVAAGDDFRTPPAQVRRVFDAFRADEGVKEWWLCEPARHARVFDIEPEAYRDALHRLVQRMIKVDATRDE